MSTDRHETADSAGAVGVVAAEDGWQALRSRCIRERRGTSLIVVEGGQRDAHLWPTSQVVSAALARAVVFATTESATALVVNPANDAADLDAGLARYQLADVYADSVRRVFSRPNVYFDDNAWIALNLLQTGLLQVRRVLPGDPNDAAARARAVVEFLGTGESPDGGVEWKLGGDTRNACSTAPAGLAALRLVELERVLNLTSDDHGELIAFAIRCSEFVLSLQNTEGVIADHLRADGSIEPSVYSYNQGTTIGLHLALGRIAESSAAIETAGALARTSTAYYTEPDRLWRESPAFVAILLRHLAVLRADTGTDVGQSLQTQWLAQALNARDPVTGFYTGNGIGSYDGSIALDQAGIVAALFVSLMPRDLVSDLC
jgi:predicted alpha-1,6-mannanase (GH76 family)